MVCIPEYEEEEEEEASSSALRRLPTDFFSAHLLREQEDGEGWFRCHDTDRLPSLIVERRGGGGRGQSVVLKLLSAPGYHPSFQAGLHTARVKRIVFGVNRVRKVELCIAHVGIYLRRSR